MSRVARIMVSVTRTLGLRRSAPRIAALGTLLMFAPFVALAAKGEKPAKSEKPGKPDKVEKVEKVPKSERSSGKGAPASSTSSSARSSAAASTTAQFEPFRLIVDRNIFNPNRTGRSRASEESAAPKVETVALVGTMETEEGRVAFFDSTDAAFQKAVRAGDKVGEFTVKQINAGGIELTRDDKTIPVRVNQQLRRIVGGDWRVTGRDPMRAEIGRATEPTGPAAPAIPANASEVLRRLMEQRQKQLKQ